MTTKRALKREVSRLWDLKGSDTTVVITLPENALRDDDKRESTDGDCQVDGELVIPHYKPTKWSGITLVTKSGIAAVWDSMPPEVQTKEYDLRVENDDPIPPILQSDT